MAINNSAQSGSSIIFNKPMLLVATQAKTPTVNNVKITLIARSDAKNTRFTPICFNEYPKEFLSR